MLLPSSTSTPNPLTALILPILRRHPQGLTEYQLIQALKAEGVEFGDDTGDADLALFRTHFLVMNALYRLQRSLLGEGMWLDISALEIGLRPLRAGGGREISADAGQGSLRDYYLDMDQLHHTTGDEVRDLLSGFWQRFTASGDQRATALAQLGLDALARWPEIQQAYRRQAARAHPDRGGDTQAFMRIREAYETLKCMAPPKPASSRTCARFGGATVK